MYREPFSHIDECVDLGHVGLHEEKWMYTIAGHLNMTKIFWLHEKEKMRDILEATRNDKFVWHPSFHNLENFSLGPT